MKALSSWYAMVEGAVLVAFGLFLLKSSGLFVSGTAGLGLIASYMSGISFGLSFLLINVPFFILAWFVIGKEFVAKTLFCIALVSGMTDMMLLFIEFKEIPEIVAATIAGAVIGVGMVVILRFGGSLGGVNIVAVFLERKLGVKPGVTIMVSDILIAALGALLIGFAAVIYSVVCTLVLTSVLGRYHRPVTQPISEKQNEQELAEPSSV